MLKHIVTQVMVHFSVSPKQLAFCKAMAIGTFLFQSNVLQIYIHV